jgi:peptidoglycan/LPS O-acetylase OafA/YrhL
MRQLRLVHRGGLQGGIPHQARDDERSATGLSAAAARSEAGRITSLDGIRAFAVLAVVAYHVTSLAPGGWAGVDIFFVLSGYLITDLLVREYDRGRRINLPAFWGRRAIRLLPALITVIVLVLAVGWWRADPNEGLNRFWGPLSALGYFANFRGIHPETMPLLPHAWSLSLEEQFYLTWPPILWLLMHWRVSRQVLARWLLGIAIAVNVYCAALYFNGASPFRLTNLPDTHSAGLLLGCALALWLPGSTLRARIRRRIQLLALALVVLFPFFVALGSYAKGVPFVGGYAAISLATAVLLIERLRCPTPTLNRLFDASWAVWLGQRSYELYLVHYPILVVLRRAGCGTVLQFVIGVPVAIALSAAIHSLWAPAQQAWRAQLRRHSAREATAGRHRPRAVERAAVPVPVSVRISVPVGVPSERGRHADEPALARTDADLSA